MSIQWGQYSGISDLCFHPDGKTIASSGSWCVKTWDPLNASSFGFGKEQHHQITNIAISPNSNFLLTCDDRGYLHEWDLNRRRLARTIAKPAVKGAILAAEYSADGSTIVWSDQTGCLKCRSNESDETREFRPSGQLIELAKFNLFLRWIEPTTPACHTRSEGLSIGYGVRNFFRILPRNNQCDENSSKSQRAVGCLPPTNRRSLFTNLQQVKNCPVGLRPRTHLRREPILQFRRILKRSSQRLPISPQASGHYPMEKNLDNWWDIPNRFTRSRLRPTAKELQLLHGKASSNCGTQNDSKSS